MRPIDIALSVVPESAYPLVAIALVMGVIVGLLPLSKAVRLILLLACLPVLASAFQQLFALLPWYVVLSLLAYWCLFFARALLVVLLGKEAAGHVLGGAILSVSRTALFAAWRGVALLVRVAWRAMGAAVRISLRRGA